jgi:type IV pilus assembly protein PilW
MSSRNKHSRSQQIGFSLVEILVGLVIGLLATLVIMQVFSVFEGQKRSTTGTADAQTNGGIALYSLARDLQQAGYGLLPVSNSAIKCDAPAIQPAAAASITAVTPNVASLAPVTIVDGGTGPSGSDSITIRYGTSSAAGTPMDITGKTGAVAGVDNNLGCEVGIAVVLTGPTTCNLTTVINLPASSVTLGDSGSFAVNNKLACLGQWHEVTYRANAGNLERQDFPTQAAPSPNVTDIVSIQAQYGISATADSNQVMQWVDAVDGSASGDWGAALTTDNRNRIKAVRVAMIARNSQLEKVDVSQACSSITNNNPTGVCAWQGVGANALSIPPTPASPAPTVNLKLNSADTTWKRYRYRVFETIIPLRNVIWSKGVL